MTIAQVKAKRKRASNDPRWRRKGISQGKAEAKSRRKAFDKAKADKAGRSFGFQKK